MSDSDLQKHTLNLRAGDMDYLATVYKHQGVAPAQVVRTLVATHVNKLREQAARKNPELEPESLNVKVDL